MLIKWSNENNAHWNAPSFAGCTRKYFDKLFPIMPNKGDFKPPNVYRDCVEKVYEGRQMSQLSDQEHTNMMLPEKHSQRKKPRHNVEASLYKKKTKKPLFAVYML